MVLPLLAAALPLVAEFAPTLVRHLAGDDAGQVAERVASVALDVTGKSDLEGATAELRANPELLVQFRTRAAELELDAERSRLEADTQRQRETNITMRAEVAASDPFVRRWRPYIGYVVGTSWGVQMMALSYVIAIEPQYAAEVIAAMASLSVIWSVALALLGVNVQARSRDKQVAAGQEPAAGLLGAVTSRLRGGQ